MHCCPRLVARRRTSRSQAVATADIIELVGFSSARFEGAETPEVAAPATIMLGEVWRVVIGVPPVRPRPTRRERKSQRTPPSNSRRPIERPWAMRKAFLMMGRPLRLPDSALDKGKCAAAGPRAHCSARDTHCITNEGLSTPAIRYVSRDGERPSGSSTSVLGLRVRGSRFRFGLLSNGLRG